MYVLYKDTIFTLSYDISYSKCPNALPFVYNIIVDILCDIETY